MHQQLLPICILHWARNGQILSISPSNVSSLRMGDQPIHRHPKWLRCVTDMVIPQRYHVAAQWCGWSSTAVGLYVLPNPACQFINVEGKNGVLRNFGWWTLNGSAWAVQRPAMVWMSAVCSQGCLIFWKSPISIQRFSKRWSFSLNSIQARFTSVIFIRPGSDERRRFYKIFRNGFGQTSFNILSRDLPHW